jgi:hypothetical protein
VAILAARLAFNRALRAPAGRLAAACGRDAAHRDGGKLLEELWALCGNVATLGLALFVMIRRNGGCTFRSTLPCLEGWPNHAVDPLVALYYSLELAWYASMLLKPLLRLGAADGRDMTAHHAATAALLLAARGCGLERLGVAVLALFGLSNPLLHAAKVANQLDARGKIAAFAAFAAAFFLTRVLLVPRVVLAPSAVQSRLVLPYAVADFHFTYLAFNALLWVLYALQLLWMRSILRVLWQAATGGADAASRMSARCDPAKRYAPPCAPAPAGAAAAGEGADVHGERDGKTE